MVEQTSGWDIFKDAWMNKMTNLEKLIKMKESETLEFKKSTGEWKEIIKPL